jgi:conjugal transfer pilus assembly protein TraB
MIDLPELPNSIKRKQTLLVSGVVGGFIIIAAMVILIPDKKNKGRSQAALDEHHIVLTDLTQGAKAEDRWLHNAETQMEGMIQQLELGKNAQEEMERKITGLEQIVFAYEEEKRKQGIDQFTGSEELAQLRFEIEALKAEKQIEAQNQDIANMSPRKIVNLKFNEKRVHTHKLDNYLPAGSYVPAVVMAGVDASVGVNAQSDPRPMLFRITGKAKSAMHNHKVLKTNLTGCVVTGAASGDLSSERVFVRLVNMTCGKDEEHVTETEVKGYAVAIGKAGIRGQVVSREGDFVVKSFFAGLASGLGDGVANSFKPSPSLLGYGSQNQDAKDIAGSGIGKGVSNASGRLSEYMIDRAEQYQPVISVPSGLDVELVFHTGVHLDGREQGE